MPAVNQCPCTHEGKTPCLSNKYPNPTLLWGSIIASIRFAINITKWLQGGKLCYIFPPLIMEDKHKNFKCLTFFCNTIHKLNCKNVQCKLSVQSTMGGSHIFMGPWLYLCHYKGSWSIYNGKYFSNLEWILTNPKVKKQTFNEQ